MYPTALLRAGIVVVADIEVAHQVAVELATQQPLEHRLPTPSVVFIVADGLLAGRTEAPDVTVLTVLAPAGLIAVQQRTGPRLLLEPINHRLQRAAHLMQQFNHLAATEG